MTSWTRTERIAVAFDVFDDAYSLRYWRGLPIRRFDVAVADLRSKMPAFELRAFGVPPHHNPRMRCIVRTPTNDDPYDRPVAAVSDQYELLQHQVTATWLIENLTEAGWEDSTAEVLLTEYGERVRIIVPLTAREIDISGDLFINDRYRPELEVMNSVDRSTAFTVLLRWRRLICLNGMFTVEEDRIRSIHRVDLSRTSLVREFIAERLAETPDVVSELKVWRKKKVDRKKVQEWVEGWLRDKGGWKVENCARMWHILATGYDGSVKAPGRRFERYPLSEYRVGQERQVPGIPFPVETAYDVAQVLTWITSNQRTVEFQVEGTEDVPRLMRKLLKP